MILLVEDEPLIRMVTADALVDAGFQVMDVGNATDALARLGDTAVTFEAVVVDIGLPDQPGDVLARQIRSNWAELPILIASGRDGGSVTRLFNEDRKVGFVGKPYTGTVLIEALRALGVSADSSGQSHLKT
jgi:DNA-binding response OmpR family regulator